MTTNGCFCAPKADLVKLKEEIERNAVLLDGLSDVAPAAAPQLRALPTAPHTAFGCGGPH
jgi:hypothetical protein